MLDIPTSIISQEDAATDQYDEDIFLTELSSSQMILVCVEVTEKLASTNPVLNERSPHIPIQAWNAWKKGNLLRLLL